MTTLRPLPEDREMLLRTLQVERLDTPEQRARADAFAGAPRPRRGASGRRADPLRGGRCARRVGGGGDFRGGGEAFTPARAVDRLERRATPPPPRAGGQQRSLPAVAGARRAQSGLGGVEPRARAAQRRLAGPLRAPAARGRDLRRSGTFSGHRLPGQRLDGTGADQRERPPRARLLRKPRQTQTPLCAGTGDQRPAQPASGAAQARAGRGGGEGAGAQHAERPPRSRRSARCFRRCPTIAGGSAAIRSLRC